MRMPSVSDRVAVAVDAAAQQLGEEGFNAAFEDGRRLDLDEVTAYALRSRGERARPSTGWGSLTPTEHGVIDQVRLGLTNSQIAQRLLISPDTVKTHLSHIYAKVGVANRTELASVAHDHDSADAETTDNSRRAARE
jgi:DNA-binding CsgD family transcriptional regulator